jgi:hypothetical protein
MNTIRVITIIAFITKRISTTSIITTKRSRASAARPCRGSSRLHQYGP